MLPYCDIFSIWVAAGQANTFGCYLNLCLGMTFTRLERQTTQA